MAIKANATNDDDDEDDDDREVYVLGTQIWKELSTLIQFPHFIISTQQPAALADELHSAHAEPCAMCVHNSIARLHAESNANSSSHHTQFKYVFLLNHQKLK